MNNNSSSAVSVGDESFLRIPIKTHVVTPDDDIIDVLNKYASPILENGDILFLSEKMVACAEGRVVKIEDVEVSRLARLLSRFVEPTYSEGLGLPQTMQTAIDEVGAIRILFAAFCGALGKLLHKRGWFYVIAGTRVSHIDGPSLRTIPPYDEEIVLSVLKPNEKAKAIAEKIGAATVIIDANPYGCRLCGTSDPDITEDRIGEILKDNPLGQECQSTPCGIIRKL